MAQIERSLLKTAVSIVLIVHFFGTVDRVVGHPRPIGVRWVSLQGPTGDLKAKRQPFLWLLECGLVNVLWWSSKQGQREFTAMPLFPFRVQQLLIHCDWNVRNYSHPCCHRVGPFWVHFVHFGSIWVHFGSILLIVSVVMHESLGVQSAFKQESVFGQESVFRQEYSFDKSSSLDC